jgi:RND family efflux transporter MFP subunit
VEEIAVRRNLPHNRFADPTSRRGLSAVLVPLAAGALLALGACGGDKEAPAKAPAVSTASAPVRAEPASRAAGPEGTWITVTRGSIREYAPAVGSFHPRKTTQIGSQVSGRVRDVLVDVGDVVKKDQELVRLDPVFFEIEVAQSQAKIQAAKIAVTDAELNFRRMKNLWEKPSSSGPPSIARKLYDDARLKLEATTADRRQAEQALRYAEQRLKESVIRAPYDAVVTKRLVDPGEPVTAAPAIYLLNLQELKILELEFSMPQNMLSLVKVGTPLEFEVEGIAGGAGQGTIAVIYPAIEEATRSFHCRAYVENPNLKYRPGLLAQVRVLTGQIDGALVAPRKAVTQTATGWQVAISNNGHPVPRNVAVGMVTEDRVQITDGLKEGARVFMVSGN